MAPADPREASATRDHGQHLDAQRLALRALGEPTVSAADAAREQAHLDGCDRCRHEFATLDRVVAAARADERVPALVAPPPSTWAGIRAELARDGVELPADPGSGLPRDATASSPTPDRPVVVRPPVVDGRQRSAGTQQTAGAPLARGGRRTRRAERLAVLAGVAAGVGLGVVGTLGLGALTDDSDNDSGTAPAALATLDPLPAAPDASGRAAVLGVGSDRTLRVDASGLPQASGYYEVWLLDTNAARLVPLGLLRGGTGTFPLPEGLDTAAFPVVDVSLEPLDGDPSHSGDSRLRGTLRG